MCPHWQYFEYHADPKNKRKRSRFAEMLLDAGVINEREIIGKMQLQPVKGKTTKERIAATKERMAEGVDMIYHGVLEDGDLIGEPDLLEKRLGKTSKLGAYYYVPIDIKSAEHMSDGHKYQLALYAELLASNQGLRPEEAYIINGYGVTMGFNIDDFRPKLLAAIDEVRQARAGNPLPPFVSSGCKQSPWFDECLNLAKKSNDIALLYNIRESTMNKFREHGVHTIEQVAHADASELARNTDTQKKTVERHKLQAEALVTGKHTFRHPAIFPDTTKEIFFDIEGDPLRQLEYLFGVLVREGSHEEYVSFIAEDPKDEEKMWRAFLEWITELPQSYVVYHYGNYEMVRLEILAKRYGDNKALEKFKSAMIDLAETVKDTVVFPLYFYSIKDIGNYIGYKRSKKIKSGGDSIGFYEDWLKDGDRKKLQAVIEYNEDDVIATRALKDWLAKESPKP